MTHPLAPALDVFWHNAWMLRNAVNDLPPEQESFQLGNCNPFNRVVGHIVATRHGLAKTLGIDAPDPGWGEFGAFKLAAQFDANLPCPPVSEIMEAFAGISEAMVAGMEAMTLEDLRKPSPMPIPGEDPDLLDLIAFFAMHESYHIGQLSIMAKCMGRKGVMGG
ncbi:MAG: DinB family protein [Rhodothermales bacterium]|nr:DinB family protein [Rhodothermales bacterium]MBO6781453.1 DinB family protein [Rhodothermales bacterium]